MHLKSRRGLLLALLLLVTAAIGALAVQLSVGFGGQTSASSASPSLDQLAASARSQQLARNPMGGSQSVEQHLDIADPSHPSAESDELFRLEDYWAQRVAYPTGRFDGTWIQNAAAQDKQIARGVPTGKQTYTKSPKAPLVLNPTSFVNIGPNPEQTDACYSCFNYGPVSGRINWFAIDPVTPNVAYAATVGGGIFKTTNCCTASTSWFPTTDDALLGSIATDWVTLDPNNHNTVYAATGDLNFGTFSFGSYGILKSTDAGSTWQVKGANVFGPYYPQPPASAGATPQPQFQSVGRVIVDPRNSNNVIAGAKTGVYFSYDGGDNWSGPCLPDTFSSQRQDVTGLLTRDTGSATEVIVAIGARGYSGAQTNAQYNLNQNGANGVYKAIIPSGGCPASWTLSSRPDNGWLPGTGNGIGFFDYNGVQQAGGNPNGRIDLAQSPSNPNVIYAQVQMITATAVLFNPPSRGAQLGVWRTTDGGVTWEQRSTGSALNASGCGAQYPQNWYDQGMAVDPNNPDVLYLDTYDIFKSNDGAKHFIDVTCGYTGGTTVHVDQHALAYVPGSSSVLLAGSDGGAYVAIGADVMTPTESIFHQINNNLPTIEFYSGDITGNFANSANPGANGGAQDNGSSFVIFNGQADVSSKQWQLRTGGDGFFARIEPMFNQRWYQGGNSGSIVLYPNGPSGPGNNVAGAWYPARERYSFILPYEIYKGTPGTPATDCDPTNGCTHMIAGTFRVWETINGATTGSSSWYVNSPDLTKNTTANSYINQLAYAPSISTTAIAGTNDGNVWYGFNMGMGAGVSTTLTVTTTANWVNVTGGNAVLPNRPILDVTIDPKYPLYGFAAVGGFNANTPSTPGHVFMITCGANCSSFNWVNKSGNLPDIPADSIIVNPNYREQVFVGTAFGLYYTNNIDANPPTWEKFVAGLPSVTVWDMQVDRGATTLSLWTRGRSAYVWPLPAAPFVQPTNTPTVTGTPPTATPQPTNTPDTSPCFNYAVITGTATIVAGSTDTGNHCDDCVTTISLPFPVTIYGKVYNSAYVNSNGSLEFGLASASNYSNCLPDRNQFDTVIAYQGDLCTTGCGSGAPACPTCGVFTTVQGSAPNRQFIVEWRAVDFPSTSATPTLDFEVILNESSGVVTVVYGNTGGQNGAGHIAGIEHNASRYTQLACNQPILVPGLRADYVPSTCPTNTPAPTSTQTATFTVGPSSTSTPLPSATPTQCGTYPDVDQYNPFFVYIKCLSCRGIVSGFGDGTFRPNDQVTRGQASKMIANAAGFNESVSSKHFPDVNPGDTYYLYIERLANRGLIGGYPDGMFHPNWFITRGQLAKIDSNAAGFSDTPPSGTQSFADVMPGDTYYVYIERLARRGIISGYECGKAPAGPCDGQKRPYYLPNNNITRGQTAKIVSNTFFPINCAPGRPEIIGGK